MTSESAIRRLIVKLDGAVVYSKINLSTDLRDVYTNVPIDYVGLTSGTHKLEYVVTNRAGTTTSRRMLRR